MRWVPMRWLSDYYHLTIIFHRVRYHLLFKIFWLAILFIWSHKFENSFRYLFQTDHSCFFFHFIHSVKPDIYKKRSHNFSCFIYFIFTFNCFCVHCQIYFRLKKENSNIIHWPYVPIIMHMQVIQTKRHQ